MYSGYSSELSILGNASEYPQPTELQRIKANSIHFQQIPILSLIYLVAKVDTMFENGLVIFTTENGLTISIINEHKTAMYMLHVFKN